MVNILRKDQQEINQTIIKKHGGIFFGFSFMQSNDAGIDFR